MSLLRWAASNGVGEAVQALFYGLARSESTLQPPNKTRSPTPKIAGELASLLSVVGRARRWSQGRGDGGSCGFDFPLILSALAWGSGFKPPFEGLRGGHELGAGGAKLMLRRPGRGLGRERRVFSPDRGVCAGKTATEAREETRPARRRPFGEVSGGGGGSWLIFGAEGRAVRWWRGVSSPRRSARSGGRGEG